MWGLSCSTQDLCCIIWLLFFIIVFSLKDNCFTEFCGFLSNINKNHHRYTHVPSLPDLPPISHLQQPFSQSQSPVWVPIGCLFYIWYWKFLHYCLLTSPLLPSLLPPCPYVWSLMSVSPLLPWNKFINAISLDSTYMWKYTIFIFLSLTHFALYNRL